MINLTMRHDVQHITFEGKSSSLGPASTLSSSTSKMPACLHNMDESHACQLIRLRQQTLGDLIICAALTAFRAVST